MSRDVERVTFRKAEYSSVINEIRPRTTSAFSGKLDFGSLLAHYWLTTSCVVPFPYRSSTVAPVEY